MNFKKLSKINDSVFRVQDSNDMADRWLEFKKFFKDNKIGGLRVSELKAGQFKKTVTNTAKTLDQCLVITPSYLDATHELFKSEFEKWFRKNKETLESIMGCSLALVFDYDKHNACLVNAANQDLINAAEGDREKFIKRDQDEELARKQKRMNQKPSSSFISAVNYLEEGLFEKATSLGVKFNDAATKVKDVEDFDFSGSLGSATFESDSVMSSFYIEDGQGITEDLCKCFDLFRPVLGYKFYVNGYKTYADNSEELEEPEE